MAPGPLVGGRPAAAGFRGIKGDVKQSRLVPGGLAQRARSYDVLDVVDFGGPGASLSRSPSLWPTPANTGRLLLRRSEGIKDARKRWNDEKLQPTVGETSAEKAAVLAQHLSLRQPAMSAIVARAHTSGASSSSEVSQASSVRRYRRSAGRH
jgi:hypothetical protein